MLVWLFGWMLRRRLCGSSSVLKMTLKTSWVQSRFCKLTMLLIALVSWTHQHKFNRTVSVENISII